MIFNVSGGGGTALNFKVVGGTTAPANPQENTIWVNTDVDITGWVFSAVEPSEPAAGLVWFTISNSSSASFNALKKNVLMVYPISAMQYVSGAWADVTAMSYQGGEWVSWWNGEYFDNGNQFESITGGWTKNGYTHGTRTVAGTITIGETLHINLTGTINIAIVGTADTVDLTDVSTIYFNVPETSHTDNVYVGVSKTKDTSEYAVRVAVLALGLTAVDVSALSGKYYIFAYAINSTSGGEKNVTINKVYGE